MRTLVEGSDCLLLLGERLSDVSLGVSADLLRGHDLITAVARDVFIGQHQYEHTPLELLVDRLLTAPALPVSRDPIKAIGTDVSPEVFDPFKQDEAIKMRHAINLLNEFVREHEEMPLIADTGDALFASVDIRANQCIAPAYYGTMGFAVPAALGVQIASGRRPLVLVGDGAFQMTGGEISQAAVTAAIRSSCCSTTSAGRCSRRSFPTPLQRNSQLAFCQAGRSLGRTRIPRVHAAPASRCVERRIRRRPLHDHRGRVAARRRLAHPARVRRSLQETCVCLMDQTTENTRTQRFRTMFLCAL